MKGVYSGRREGKRMERVVDTLAIS